MRRRQFLTLAAAAAPVLFIELPAFADGNGWPPVPPPVAPGSIPNPPITAVNPKDNAVMIYIPPGDFTMGEDDLADAPTHTVTLDGYWIYKNDVTVAQYQAFCTATGRQMATTPTGQYAWSWDDHQDHPIVDVSWDDAKAYCDWAGCALPTEAQWEKAARGTDGRKYPWGNDWDTSRLWSSADGQKHGTAPVGAFPGGASPYGLMDMAGNVYQWCADYYNKDYYKSSPGQNPTGPTYAETRALRGGSWSYGDEPIFRCAYRNGISTAGFSGAGFRCAARAGSN